MLHLSILHAPARRDSFFRLQIAPSLVLAFLTLFIGCRAEVTSRQKQVTYGTRLVLLESGIHWAEWIRPDNTPCGDVYKWNDEWIADTYRDGLQQTPFETKDEAVAWVQKFCK